MESEEEKKQDAAVVVQFDPLGAVIVVHVYNTRTTTIGVSVGIARASISSGGNTVLLVPVESSMSVVVIDQGHSEELCGELQARKHSGVGVPFPPSLYGGKFLQFVASKTPLWYTSPAAIHVQFRQIMCQNKYVMHVL